MTLEGAKIICLDADEDGEFQTIPATSKTFKFGYYMDCDVVLEHPHAIGLHCIINCDAFGRVTIENRCNDKPVTLDGKPLAKMRPLLHNTEICILDKKYLWHFEGNRHTRGFQMEDTNVFTTPKKTNACQQPPNSEPSREWREVVPTRLTIHSFAYCIKPNIISKYVETSSDDNKPVKIEEEMNEDMDTSSKQIISLASSPTLKLVSDSSEVKSAQCKSGFLNHENFHQLSFCNLSETVITSYSPRETGIRQEKSFAIVQSPLTTTKIETTMFNNVSLGPFYHIKSPQTAPNYSPSMHLIDLITPKKLTHTVSSPNRTLLKSTLQKNLPKGITPRTPKRVKKTKEFSTPGSSDTVYSVQSTDDESVILLSDDCSETFSPVTKTPPKVRTPQSLMKRAILSSAKKVAISTHSTLSKQIFTPTNSKNPTAVRFQSHSTPQRKSLAKFPSSAESLSARKLRKSLVTSTPFRQRIDIKSTSSSRRSLVLSSQCNESTNESRNSTMLKQAISMSKVKSVTPSVTSPKTTITPKSKSILSTKIQKKSRKSVSFSQRVEKEQHANTGVLQELDVEELLNSTFTIEEDNIKRFGSVQNSSLFFHPKSEKKVEVTKCDNNSSLTTQKCEISVSTENSMEFNVLQSANKSQTQDFLKKNNICNQPDTGLQKKLDVCKDKNPISSQSSKHVSTINENTYQRLNSLKIVDDDFDCIDEIFKTPKAKNLMIRGSPKSISLQKMPADSVELIHSTKFDLTANLGDLFQTPQSELITRQVGVTTPADSALAQVLSAEEAFNNLIGRPVVKKIYVRKTPQKKHDLSTLKISNNSSFPKTDIEEWIDSVTDILDDPQDEYEISYLTAKIIDISRDPLTINSIKKSAKSEKGEKEITKEIDEFEMTIKEDGEEKHSSKDPLESSVQRSLSPNISGIELLDNTTESVFSEALVYSDDSSIKDTEKTITAGSFNDDIYSQTETSASLEDKLPEKVEVSKSKNPAKAEREMELAFENFEEPTISEERLIQTLDQRKVTLKDHRNTLGSALVSEEKLDIRAAKAEREMELAFENFEEEPTISEERLVKTPEQRKVTLKDHRRTLGNALVSEGKLDIQAAKAEREMELAFENFEEVPTISEERLVKTPEQKKVTLKDHRRTLGSALVSEVKLDIQAAKAEREMELAFENFEEVPTISEERLVKTPEQKKVNLKDYRRTLGSALIPEMKLDIQAAKAEREMELAFENFEEEPTISEERLVKTPDQLAFKNFEEEPTISKERLVKTPEQRKVTLKDHRRTLGNALVSEVKLDIQAAKAEREMELAFENFEEEPTISEERLVKTPDQRKVTLKDHRRTLGSALVSEVKLDIQAAKAEREMELAFENFEEEPTISEERLVKTPGPKKMSLKYHRRTLGSALVSEVKLNIQAAKAEREMELAFENFEEVPTISEERLVKTPEQKKVNLKDHRRTLGSALVSEVKLDIQAAKAEREMELAFKNFEEEPTISKERLVKTPEQRKVTLKDHRRTLGNALVSEVKLDIQAAKAEREMELAFENFEEEPTISEERLVKTPDQRKVTLKDHRRTLGSALVSEVKLDIQAAKAEREMELAFENFEEEPTISEERLVKTPGPKKMSLKYHRRTLGSALVSEVKLDIQAAKAEREMELAFENFEEVPTISKERLVKTPEQKKVNLKDHRRTLGSALIPEMKLDIQAAKAEREMELAFENFEEEPTISEERLVKTPDQRKVTLKDHRSTLGSALVSEEKLDIRAAKAEREVELAFENFEEEPTIFGERRVKTPEQKKVNLKDHRRTLGSALVSEVKLDIQTAKAEREMELAFENFEEEPTISEERLVKPSEQRKVTLQDHRRTLDSALVSEVKLDIQAAKAEREMELAFENFEEEPTISEERLVKTPDQRKVTLKDHRRTLGSALVSEVKLDIQAAKAEREMELAFENFEEEPTISEERLVKTPGAKKMSLKYHRRTLGSALVSEVKLDIQAAKAEREMELAFENFEEVPTISEERLVKTPEQKKVNLKDHRRTLGSALIPEMKLDIQAANAEREMELAFENFEEEPTISEERLVKTPDQRKVTLKDHRSTLGSALVSEEKLDIRAAKAEREVELAFENFEEEPTIFGERLVKTPEQKKVNLKDHRRTLGSALVSEVKLDIQTAKAEREMELAFENFEEEPTISEERLVKPSEQRKVTLQDHRRTLDSAVVSEVKLELEGTNIEREKKDLIEKVKKFEGITMNVSIDNVSKDSTAQILQSDKKSGSVSSLKSIRTLRRRQKTIDTKCKMLEEAVKTEQCESESSIRRRGVRKIGCQVSKKSMEEKETKFIRDLESNVQEVLTPKLKTINHGSETKALLNNKTDADKIVNLSPMVSRSRIRGRKGQLNVLLTESRNSNISLPNSETSQPIDSLNALSVINGDSISKKRRNKNIDSTNIAEECIPSTPLSVNSAPRRLTKTTDAFNTPVLLKKTQKDSVKENNELLAVEKNECIMKKENYSSGNNEKTSGVAILDLEVSNEDIVPSTPLERKTRRRQVPKTQTIHPNLEQFDSKDVKTKIVDSKFKIVEADNRSQKDTDTDSNSSIKTSKTRRRRPNLRHENVFESTTERINLNKDISEVIPNKTPTHTNEIILLKEQDCSTDESITNLENFSVQEIQPVPTMVKKCISKVDADLEKATSKRGVGRSKLSKNENKIEYTDTDGNQINDNSSQIESTYFTSFNTENENLNEEKLDNLNKSNCKEQNLNVRNIKKDPSKSPFAFRSKEIHSASGVPINLENVKSDNVERMYKRCRKQQRNEQIIEKQQLEYSENHEDLKLIIEDKINIPPVVSEKIMAPVQANDVETISKRCRKQRQNEQIIEKQLLDYSENHEDLKLRIEDIIIIPPVVPEKIITPVSANKRGRKATVKKEPEEPTLIIATPNTRTRRRKNMEVSLSDSKKITDPLGAEIQEDKTVKAPTNVLSPNTQRQKGLNDLKNTTIKGSTPIRKGSQRNIEKNQNVLEFKTIADANEVLVEPLSIPSKRNGTRTRGAKAYVENNITESVVEVQKSRGRKATRKIEVVDNLKVEQKKTKVIIEKDPIKSETSQPENSLKLQNKTLKRDKGSVSATEGITNVLSGTDIHKISPDIKRKKRSSMDDQHERTKTIDTKSDEPNISTIRQTLSKECEQSKPTIIKLDKEITAEEDSTPVKKRGRRAIIQTNIQKKTPPTRSTSRKANAKNEAVVNFVREGLVSNFKEEEKIEDRSESEQNHGDRILTETNSSPKVFLEDLTTELDVKAQKKSTRFRVKASENTNSALEYLSNTKKEEKEPSNQAKPKRGRKVNKEPDLEQEIEKLKVTDTKLEAIQNEHDKNDGKKPKRGRKPTTIQTSDNSPLLDKSIKLRQTRSQKAAMKNSKEEPANLSIVLDVPTQSVKESEKEMKLSTKRRNLPTDQTSLDDTPSKRTRRKPIKLLSDEYIT